jgi:uncharacterized membrane protein
MKRLFWIAPFVLLAAAALCPVPAVAGLHICNKTDNKVYVAVATVSGDCIVDYCDYGVKGWWTIEPQGCKTPIGAGLDASGDTDYYYYAEDSDGATWTGSLTLCVDPHDAFDFNDSQEAACASGTHRRFKEISTDRSTDYTLSLTP